MHMSVNYSGQKGITFDVHGDRYTAGIEVVGLHGLISFDWPMTSGTGVFEVNYLNYFDYSSESILLDEVE